MTEYMYTYNCTGCDQQVTLNTTITACIHCGEEEHLEFVTSYNVELKPLPAV